MRKSVLLTLMLLVMALSMAISSVTVFAEGYLLIEFEDADDWNQDIHPLKSDDHIKFEGTNDANVGPINNVGGTFDGGWLLYQNVNFGNNGAKAVTVQYCNNSGRCAADSKIELRLGSIDGELIAEIDLPATGNDWKTYDTTTVNLKRIVTGKHDLYVVMVGSTDAGHPFIANLDYMEFTEAAPGEAPTPSPGEENTPTPAEETPSPSASAQSQAPAASSPAASPTATAEPVPGGNGPSAIIYIVIAVVIVCAAVIAFFVIKNKKK